MHKWRTLTMALGQAKAVSLPPSNKRVYENTIATTERLAFIHKDVYFQLGKNKANRL